MEEGRRDGARKEACAGMVVVVVVNSLVILAIGLLTSRSLLHSKICLKCFVECATWGGVN